MPLLAVQLAVMASTLSLPPQLLPTLAAPLSFYDNMLGVHPVTTRIITAASLATAGDTIAQRREKLSSFDFRRTASFIAVEATYRGIMQQPIFEWIIRTFDGKLLSSLFRLSDEAKLPLLAAWERVLFNQFVVSPGVYYPLYFGITGTAQGLSLWNTFRRARSHFATLFGCNLCFWLPVQLVQFLAVPAKYKVPYICVREPCHAATAHACQASSGASLGVPRACVLTVPRRSPSLLPASSFSVAACGPRVEHHPLRPGGLGEQVARDASRRGSSREGRTRSRCRQGSGAAHNRRAERRRRRQGRAALSRGLYACTPFRLKNRSFVLMLAHN